MGQVAGVDGDVGQNAITLRSRRACAAKHEFSLAAQRAM
jgi:hypothetical protein